MKRIFEGLLLLGLSVPFFAFAEDLETLQRLMANRQCPRDLATYELVKAKEQCGEIQPGSRYYQCAKKVNEINDVLFRYNNFIRECRRTVDRRYTR